MTTEAVQSAKDSIKKVYPDAEFIKKEFTPTPLYYTIFDESVIEDVVCLASCGICVRKNEKTLDSSSDRLSESAFQFNDALLDEQKKKIDDLEGRLKKSDSDYIDKVHLACVRGREIAKLNKIIHDKNVMIKNLISDRGKVARELTAEKAVHKIDLQTTKSAESALLYHEKEYKKSLQEKDEVIDDLSRELAHSKEREEELIATVKDYVNEIEELKGKTDKIKQESQFSDLMDAFMGKKKPKPRFSAPKQGRIIVFSSGNPRNNFLDELRKSFFED